MFTKIVFHSKVVFTLCLLVATNPILNPLRHEASSTIRNEKMMISAQNF